jgi:hypothetical protein
MHTASITRSVLVVGPLLLLAFVACGSEADGSTFTDPGYLPPREPVSNLPGPLPSEQAKQCDGLECQQVSCQGGATTTITGTVMAPNGTLPLYNVIVYVPNAPLEPIASGASCDRCGHVSGKPLVSAVTGVDGKFELKNVPAGADIPLVMQVGKWRRVVTLPKVEQCTNNAITDVNLTRLPKNRTEGDIPQIAVTTGRCDQLACLLPKLGLDASEFTTDSGPGALHLYRGASHPTSNPVAAPAPTGSRDADSLTADVASLKKYDIVMLSCECGEHNETKPAEAKKALYDFMSQGGRVFASHFQYTWADEGPLASTAEWVGSSSNPENKPGPYLVDQTFPKGAAFAEWLVNVQASKTLGEVPISQPRHNVEQVMPTGQRWVYRQDDAMTNYLTVNTPVGVEADKQCGKFVFGDMHLYGGDVQPAATALPDDGFPGSCSKELTPEEKALVFLFFDLASCIQDDKLDPLAPIR